MSSIPPEYLSKLTDRKLIPRRCLVMAILELGAISLGIAFFIIIHGFLLGVSRFVFYWKPAFIIYTKVMNIKDVDFIRVPIPWWRAILLGIEACIALFFIYFGIKLLITHGILEQNLLYQIIVHS